MDSLSDQIMGSGSVVKNKCERLNPEEQDHQKTGNLGINLMRKVFLSLPVFFLISSFQDRSFKKG